MARKNQDVVESRKSPRQARALVTVDAIFEATARIIEEAGTAGLTTNHIAERAGVSVGSLYGYFPNKEAILIALARRQLDLDRRTIGGTLAAALASGSPEPERPIVRALMALHADRSPVRRAIMGAHIAHGLGHEHAVPVQDVAARLREAGGEALENPAALFVLTRAVIGIVRAAFEERSPLFGSPALEDELCRLIGFYLRPPMAGAL
jgi:AcrR family transcriptional regulator